MFGNIFFCLSIKPTKSETVVRQYIVSQQELTTPFVVFEVYILCIMLRDCEINLSFVHPSISLPKCILYFKKIEQKKTKKKHNIIFFQNVLIYSKQTKDHYMYMFIL